MPSGGGYSVVLQDHLTPTSAAAVAEASPAGAVGFFITVQTQDARVSLDGTAATSTNGLVFKAGVQEPIYIPIAVNLSVIGLNASASDITILWVK